MPVSGWQLIRRVSSSPSSAPICKLYLLSRHHNGYPVIKRLAECAAQLGERQVDGESEIFAECVYLPEHERGGADQSQLVLQESGEEFE